MRPPNPRLSTLANRSGDDGMPGDTITLYTTEYLPDPEGNPVATPTPFGTFLAIVDRQDATMIQGNNTTESSTSYSFLIYSDDELPVVVEDAMTWNSVEGRGKIKTRDLIAAGRLIPSGPGAYSGMAVEIGPNPDGDTDPYVPPVD